MPPSRFRLQKWAPLESPSSKGKGPNCCLLTCTDVRRWAGAGSREVDEVTHLQTLTRSMEARNIEAPQIPAASNYFGVRVSPAVDGGCVQAGESGQAS